MNSIKMVAIVLVLAGVLALLYGGFSYTRETHDLELGAVSLAVKEKQTVNIPIWAGVGAIVAGGLLLAMSHKRG